MSASRFRELADVVGVEIEKLEPGARIASEHEIADRYGVSRATARATLEELRRRHLVRRLQGAGTFRSRRVDYWISPDHVPSWSASVREAGSEPHVIVQSCDSILASGELVDRLRVNAGTRCFELRRRSFADGLPAAWGTEWMPEAIVPDLPVAVRLEQSLHIICRDMARVEPKRSFVVASMDVATAEVARELELRTGDLVWRVESVNEDAVSGRPLYFSRRWIRADAIRVVLALGGSAAASPAGVAQ